MTTTEQTTPCARCAQPCSQGYYVGGYSTRGEFYCCDECLHANGYTRADYDADFLEGCACWTTVDVLQPIPTPDADPTLPSDLRAIYMAALFFIVALALTRAFLIN